MIVLALPGVEMTSEWWGTLAIRQQLLYAGIGLAVILIVANFGVKRALGVSLVAIVAATVNAFRDPGTLTGREIYKTGPWNTIKRRFSRSDENTIPVDTVYKKGLDSPASPEVDRGVSTGVAGQTGKGKSSFVKDDVRRWGPDESIFAHGLRQDNGRNEVRDFLDEQGYETLSMSSDGSEARWDPFLDLSKDLASMQNLAEGLYTAEQLKETGWTKSEKMLLTAMLVYCSAEYDDFAYLQDVLETAPEEVIKTVAEIPEAELAVQSLQRADTSDLDVIYNNVNAVMSSLAMSDICDPSLPSVELTEFCKEPDGRAVVLDNVTSDVYANGFWRVLTTSAIDIAHETAGRQQFWLDEVDQLPRISNLKKLAKAGRKSGARGIIVVQDAHQLINTYGDRPARSIWSNCPNRVMFSAGDADTAELFLSGLGDRELHQRDVSTKPDGEGGTMRTSSTRIVDGKPLLTGELMNQEPGKALIQSPAGWWHAKISEPSF